MDFAYFNKKNYEQVFPQWRKYATYTSLGITGMAYPGINNRSRIDHRCSTYSCQVSQSVSQSVSSRIIKFIFKYVMTKSIGIHIEVFFWYETKQFTLFKQKSTKEWLPNTGQGFRQECLSGGSINSGGSGGTPPPPWKKVLNFSA